MTISTHVFFWVFEKLIKVALNFSEKMNIIMRNVFQHWYLIFNLVGNVFLNSLIISKAIWKYISNKVENQISVLKYISHYDIHILSVYPQCSFFYIESKFFSKRYLKKFNHNEKNDSTLITILRTHIYNLAFSSVYYLEHLWCSTR